MRKIHAYSQKDAVNYQKIIEEIENNGIVKSQNSQKNASQDVFFKKLIKLEKEFILDSDYCAKKERERAERTNQRES